MQGSNRKFTVALSCLLMAAVNVAGLDLKQGGAPLQLGLNEVAVQSKSPKQLKKLPEVRSSNAVFLIMALGSGDDGEVYGLIDESGGTGAGYDTLHIDSNNNRNLKDDPVIGLEIEKGARSASLNVPVDVKVKYADGESRQVGIKLALRIYQQGKGGKAAWSVGCELAQHLEGKVDIGDRKNLLVAVYDASKPASKANGCFNDYGIDRFRIDLDGDGVLDPKKEDFPLSKVVSMDGALWKLALDPGGTKLNISKSDVTAGKVKIAASLREKANLESVTADLVSADGVAVRYRGGVMAVPVGRYEIVDGKMLAVDGDGKKWTASFGMTGPIEVKADGVLELRLGAPLTVVPEPHDPPRLGTKICIEPKLKGVAGESYENISVQDSRMTPMTVITDSSGIVVAEGRMDYG